MATESTTPENDMRGSQDATTEALAQIEMLRAELRAMLLACDDLRGMTEHGTDWAVVGTISVAYGQCSDCADTIRDLLGVEE